MGLGTSIFPRDDDKESSFISINFKNGFIGKENFKAVSAKLWDTSGSSLKIKGLIIDL